MRKLILAGGLFVLLAVGMAAAQVTAIRAGKVVDPETGKVSVDQVILIEGQDIKAIGADVKIPAGAAVIDLSKFTVMPGMFDAHAHLCMNMQHKRDAGRYYYTTLNDSNAMRAIQGVANARSMLEHGFTTVRDIGNEGNYAGTDLRRAIEQELVPGPTIINAGRIIAPYGGQFGLQPDKQNLAEPEYFFADTRDEIKKAIRQNIHYGATVIKLVIDDQRYIYSVDDIKFAIEEAHLAGCKTRRTRLDGSGCFECREGRRRFDRARRRDNGRSLGDSEKEQRRTCADPVYRNRRDARRRTRRQ